MSREIQSVAGVSFQADLVRGVRVELRCDRCSGTGRPVVRTFSDANGDCFYCRGHGFVHTTLDLSVLKQLLAKTEEKKG